MRIPLLQRVDQVRPAMPVTASSNFNFRARDIASGAVHTTRAMLTPLNVFNVDKGRHFSTISRRSLLRPQVQFTAQVRPTIPLADLHRPPIRRRFTHLQHTAFCQSLCPLVGSFNRFRAAIDNEICAHAVQ